MVQYAIPFPVSSAEKVLPPTNDVMYAMGMSPELVNMPAVRSPPSQYFGFGVKNLTTNAKTIPTAMYMNEVMSITAMATISLVSIELRILLKIRQGARKFTTKIEIFWLVSGVKWPFRPM